jgi:hypothetical protein
MSSLLTERYSRLCEDLESDIYAHLPVLRALARECRHVTEFGVRAGASTTAFLHAAPARLVCYDIQEHPDAAVLNSMAPAGTEFVFHKQDVLTAEIEPTDLLFIDTLHTYDQLRTELCRHASKVRRYIVLHDTGTFGTLGELSGSRGLWPAIDEFTRLGDFQIKDHYPYNNGLTVLVRVVGAAGASAAPGGQPAVPVRRLKKRTIARCTPSLGTVSIWWVQSAEQMLWPMNLSKTTLFMRDWVGDEIAENRNRLVDLALGLENDDMEVTHLFWLDDDVIVMRGALHQLLGHDRDIASGVYFSKDPDPVSRPLIIPGPGAGTERFIPNRAYETWGCGMGLTLVRTDLYKRMRDELNLPRDRYGHPEWYRTTGKAGQHDSIEMDGGIAFHGGTEDLYFCRSAAKLGVHPLIDTSKHAFGFHWDEKGQRGYPEKQWQEWIHDEPIVWDTPSGPVVWE